MITHYQHSGHLRGDVVRSTAKSSSGRATQDSFFAHTKVRYPRMTIHIQYDVVQLQIPNTSHVKACG